MIEAIDQNIHNHPCIHTALKMQRATFVAQFFSDKYLHKLGI